MAHGGDDDRIRIVVADDHAILRSGLRMLIDLQPDMQIVGEAARFSEVAAALRAHTTDVLLFDVAMPGDGPLKVLKEVVAQFPATRVIVLTMYRDISLVRSLLSAGASGFVLKQSADTDLLSAIRAVCRGGLFLDPSLARDLLPMAVHHPPDRDPLSSRERQVLKALAQGYTNQEIARRLAVSVKTVETYRTRIAEKLGLHTRAEITRYALSVGLLTAEDAWDDINWDDIIGAA